MLTATCLFCVFIFFHVNFTSQATALYCNHKNKFDDQFYQVHLISSQDGWQTRTTFAKLRKFLSEFRFCPKDTAMIVEEQKDEYRVAYFVFFESSISANLMFPSVNYAIRIQYENVKLSSTSQFKSNELE